MKTISSSFLILVLLSSAVIGPMSVSSYSMPVAYAENSDDISDISNYVIYGLEKVEIHKDVTIQSGNVGLHDDSKKKGEIKIKKDVEFIDSESSVIANKIKIEKNAVAPNVFYNELKNKGTILGTENTPITLPVVNNLPEFPEFEAGDEKIKVNKHESVILSPGDYGKIELKKGSMLIFEGGVYNIKSIKAHKDSQILFVDSSEVRVEKNVKLDKMVTLGPHPDSEINASDIVFFVGNDKKSKIEFGKSSVIHGIFFSLEGEIKIKKETQATGSFIAKKIKIEKDVNLTLDSSNDIPIEDLVNEYLELIEKLDGMGNNIGETIITPTLIEEIKSDLDRIKQIIIELQMRGYDGLIETETQGDDIIGIISYFDEITLDVLFEVVIPNGTMIIFTGFGMLDEFEDAETEQTFEQIADLINSSGVIYETLISVQDDEDTINFILPVLGKFHPSTGNTTFCTSLNGIQCGLKILYRMSVCLIGDEICQETISTGIELLQSGQVENVIPYFFPTVTINVKQFNDVDGDGGFPELGEEGVPGWQFIVHAFDPEDSSIVDQILDPLSPSNIPTAVAFGETVDSSGIVSFVELEIPRSTFSITVTQISQPGFVSTSLEGVDRFLDFDAEIDIPFIGAIKEYPTEFFGNQEFVPVVLPPVAFSGENVFLGDTTPDNDRVTPVYATSGDVNYGDNYNIGFLYNFQTDDDFPFNGGFPDTGVMKFNSLTPPTTPNLDSTLSTIMTDWRPSDGFIVRDGEKLYSVFELQFVENPVGYDNSTSLYFTKSIDDGDSWSPPVLLAEHTDVQVNGISVSGNNVYVAMFNDHHFEGGVEGCQELFGDFIPDPNHPSCGAHWLQVSDNGGDTFTPKQLTFGDSPDYDADGDGFLIVNGPIVHYFFGASDSSGHPGNPNDLFVVKSDNDGVLFSNPTPFLENPNISENGDPGVLAFSNGDEMIVFHQSTLFEDSIAYSTSPNNGMSWDTEQLFMTVDEQECEAELRDGFHFIGNELSKTGDRMFQDGEQIWWLCKSDDTVYLKYSPNFGDSWTGFTPVYTPTDMGNFGFSPQYHQVGTNLYIVSNYLDSANSGDVITEFTASSSLDANRNWTEPTILFNDFRHDDRFSIAQSGDTVYVIGKRANNDGDQIVYWYATIPQAN